MLSSVMLIPNRNTLNLDVIPLDVIPGTHFRRYSFRRYSRPYYITRYTMSPLERKNACGSFIFISYWLISHAIVSIN